MKAPINPMLSRREVLLSLAAAAAAVALPAQAKIGNVEIGVCGPIEDFAKAVEYGFDYFEPAATAIAALSDSAFAEFRDRVVASRIRCKSFNRLIGDPKLAVVGPNVNQDAVIAYLDSTMDRCRQLGGEMVLWGSPASRRVPEGFSKDEAWRQMKYYLQRAGDLAESKNMLLVIEPCNQKETNTLNTGAEALRMLRDVNHPKVRMMIDVRHMRAEKEDPEIIRTAGDQLVHFHFSSPTGGWPKTAEEDADYGRVFAFIKQIYYHWGISIEARGKYEEDAAASLAFFRKQLG
jgi:D-psicose/D-tagatose/L-ribulose 3-epimerase